MEDTSNLPLYLSDMTVSAKGMRDEGPGNTTTGTVYLNRPAATAMAVTLACSPTGAVTLPASVTIPAGEQSATFSIIGVPGQGADDGTAVIVSALLNGWIQATYLTVVKATTVLAVENLFAMPGNACVVLEWYRPPANAVEGFRVYRRLAGTSDAFTELTTAPIDSTLFVDTSLTNGASYEYSVVAVEWSGTTSVASTATGQPSSTILTLNWAQTPVDVGDEQLRMSVMASSNTGFSPGSSYLLIDGQVGNFGAIAKGGHLDTSLLSYGMHTLQVVMHANQDGISRTVALASPPFTVAVTNDVTNLDASVLFTPSEGDLMLYKADISGEPTDWTVQIAGVDVKPYSRTVVRTFSGYGNQVRFAWDGADQNGAPTPKGIYIITLNATGKNNITAESNTSLC